jgi:hypothetical protein
LRGEEINESNSVKETQARADQTGESRVMLFIREIKESAKTTMSESMAPRNDVTSGVLLCMKPHPRNGGCVNH